MFEGLDKVLLAALFMEAKERKRRDAKFEGSRERRVCLHCFESREKVVYFFRAKRRLWLAANFEAQDNEEGWYCIFQWPRERDGWLR